MSNFLWQSPEFLGSIKYTYEHKNQFFEPFDLSDLELRNIYKVLSKIEETFKITKSEFNARPINVRLEDHIDAHFLICFIGLVIIRILQYTINDKYTIKNLLENMNNFKCTHETETYINSLNTSQKYNI